MNVGGLCKIGYMRSAVVSGLHRNSLEEGIIVHLSGVLLNVGGIDTSVPVVNMNEIGRRLRAVAVFVGAVTGVTVSIANGPPRE